MGIAIGQTDAGEELRAESSYVLNPSKILAGLKHAVELKSYRPGQRPGAEGERRNPERLDARRRLAANRIKPPVKSTLVPGSGVKTVNAPAMTVDATSSTRIPVGSLKSSTVT